MTTTMMIGGLLANFVTVRTLKQVNLEKDCPITTQRKKTLNFFANGPITIINLRTVS